MLAGMPGELDRSRATETALAARAGAALVPAASRRGGGLAHLGPASKNARGALFSLISLGFLWGGPLVVGLRPLLIGGAMVVSAFWTFGLRAGLRWRSRRRFRRTPERALHELTRGAEVRLAGRARARQDQTLTTVLGQPAMVIRYLGTRGKLSFPVYWELHAVDFDLELPDGSLVWVRSDELRLLPNPPTGADEDRLDKPILLSDPSWDPGQQAWIHRIETVVPGADVEVAGIVDLVPDPRGSAGSDRQPRLAPVLVGEPGRPLYVDPDPGTHL
jgi:hypothetical protein